MRIFLLMFLLGAVQSVLTGCDRTQATDQDIRGEGHQRLEASDIIGFPAPTDPSLVNPVTIPAGTYQIISLATYSSNSKLGVGASIARTMGIPGEIHDNDSLLVKADWKNIGQITQL